MPPSSEVLSHDDKIFKEQKGHTINAAENHESADLTRNKIKNLIEVNFMGECALSAAMSMVTAAHQTSETLHWIHLL